MGIRTPIRCICHTWLVGLGPRKGLSGIRCLSSVQKALSALLPAEAFVALAATGGGGAWPAKRLPMYLHAFVYLVGGALRKWWVDRPDAAAAPA